MTVSYTPVSTSSKLYIEFNTTYAISGSNGDDFRSNITVNTTEITWRDQIWANSAGGGTRSGTIFPIAGVYTNADTNAKIVKIKARQNSSNDTLTVDLSSCVLKISEFAN
jgi:hypothetical protein